jgi:polysaccharide export outer membrane protein
MKSKPPRWKFFLLRCLMTGMAAWLLCVALPGFAQSQANPADGQAEAASVAGDEYVVGTGDVLQVHVWKEPDLSKDAATVRPDGMISMPLLGVVKVSGMTVSQIQQMLAEKLHRYLSVAQVTVTVVDIRSKFIYITGEVNRPGAYPLAGSIDVLHLVIKAGGLSPYARRKSVYVLRSVDGKQQRIPVNYAKLLRGDAEQNVQLQEGDTVVVP